MHSILEVTRKYLNDINKQPSLHTMSPKQVRLLRANTKRPETNIKLGDIQDRNIVVRDGEEIKIRIYTPIGEGPFPIIIYFHGGGWVLNDIETCDSSCKMLALKTGAMIISVNYRLAPEYKFPIPVFDAYDAFLWTYENAQAINGLKETISVMGDSAGANLATVITLIQKELHGPKIASQVLLYPVTDLSFNTPSYYEFEKGFGLEKKDMEWFAHYYLNSQDESNHPYVAPLNAEDLSGLPPTCIIVAENDVLRDEGIAYANRLAASSVIVEQHIAKGLVHSFFTKNDVFQEEILNTVDIVDSFLKNLEI